MEGDQLEGSRRRSCLMLMLAIGAGILLVFVLLQVPTARVGPANETVTAWEGLKAFRHLSSECQIDWIATYVLAGVDWARVGVTVMVEETPRRGLVDGGKLAWAAAAEDWNHFVTRGSAQLEHGLKNVNPVCSLNFPPS